MKTIFRGFLAVAIFLQTTFLSFAPSARAAPGETKQLSEPRQEELKKSVAKIPPEKLSRDILLLYLENVRSKETALKVLKNAGASIESLKALEADFNKRFQSSQNLPKMTLKENELVVDGKPLGLKFLSYSALKITYKSRGWSYDTNKSSDENYVSLMKFIEKDRTLKSAHMIDLFIPTAQASLMGDMLGGALLGLFGGAVVSAAFGSPPLATMGLFTLGGASLGAMAYMSTLPVATGAIATPYGYPMYPSGYPSYPAYPGYGYGQAYPYGYGTMMPTYPMPGYFIK